MRLALEVAKPAFSLFFSRQDKALIMAWCAETSIANVIWLRMVVIKWRIPPIKMVECFRFREE